MLDPQGYPVQQYTNLHGSIVLEVLSDGTIVLINGTIMASGTGSPEGVVTAPPGSWYIQTNAIAPNFWWQKQTGTGNTGWTTIGAGGINLVTSVFGRAGVVVADANDYASVPNLTIGDSGGLGANIFFQATDGSIQINDGAPAANNIIFAGDASVFTAGGIAIDAINGPVAITTNGNGVTIDGGVPVVNGVTNLQVTDGVSQGLLFNTATGEVSLSDQTGGDSLAMDGAGTVNLNGGTIVVQGTALVRSIVGTNSIVIDPAGGGSITLTNATPSHFKLIGTGGAELVSAGIINFGDLINNLLSIDSISGIISATALNSVQMVGGSVSLALNNAGDDFSINTPSGANISIVTGTPNINLAAGATGAIKVTGKFNVAGLQIFANNAAAITGGLVAGDFYRTGADPDHVCVVH